MPSTSCGTTIQYPETKTSESNISGERGSPLPQGKQEQQQQKQNGSFKSHHS